jgi:hypothetical protein
MVLFASCEKEIQVKVPPFQAKLSVISMPLVGDTITVKLGKAISVSDHKTNPSLSVSNATLKIYADGVFKGDMTYDPDLEAYSSSVVAEAGRRYSIKATAPSFPEASADIVAPSVVPISNVVLKVKARIDADKNDQDELTITFNDPPALGDYYMLKIIGAADTSSMYSGYGGCVNTIDGSVETETNESIDITTCIESTHIFMRDELFNGTQKQLKFYIESRMMQPREFYGDTLYPTVALYHVTEAHFKFEKSRRVASYSNGDPFSEPANVYSNITNGYGIFSITGVDVKEIK